MQAPLLAVMCAVTVAVISIPSPTVAQQKTVEQCKDEWKANKAENQAKGIDEQEYVAECRWPMAGTPPAANVAQQKTVEQCKDEWKANKAENRAKGIDEQEYVAECRWPMAGTPAPAPARTTAAPSAVPGSKGRTAEQCRAEWQANKAENQAKGRTEKVYMVECLAGTVTQTPAETAGSAAATTPAKTQAVPAVPNGTGRYRTEAEAKGHCPSDTVVWVDLKSKVYHFAGTKNYRTAKKGAYMCEKEALAQGDRAPKVEKRP
jgi:hypothetical protein